MPLNYDDRLKQFEDKYQKQLDSIVTIIEEILNEKFDKSLVSISVKTITSKLKPETIYPGILSKVIIVYKKLGYAKSEYRPDKENSDDDWIVIG